MPIPNPTNKKRILQLGGGPLQVHSVVQLKAAGYEVHVVDVNPLSPAFTSAHASRPINITDTEAIEAYARKHAIDYIMAVNDAGVVPAADASKRLGLPGLDVQAARNATDKGLMRTRWQEADVRQPRFTIVGDHEKIEDAVHQIGMPCVLKPCLNWGSRGISLIYSKEDVQFSKAFARKADRNGYYIIEEMVPGTEMTIEGLARDGALVILSKSDKVHQQHPQYRVALELNYPSSFPEEVLAGVDALVRDAARALGIRDGAVHCEVIVNERGAFLVEMAARPGGGHIFSKIVEAQSGVPMPVSLAKIFLGEAADINPRIQKGVSYRFFAPPMGTFRELRGLEEAKQIPGVIDLGFQMQPGARVGVIEGDAGRPGYLVTQAADKQAAIDLAEKVISSLQFVMDPNEPDY